ncbi:response regulator transcription factor [Paracoccus ravus]|uniref:response regulator transcription factor n=1 Tax=Paracoccus ravus TaxID=2447760 RepID=UPI001430DEFD|nr:response regulator transcription factor [Paracoccus ravus]
MRMLFHGLPTVNSERAICAIEAAGGQVKRLPLGSVIGAPEDSMISSQSTPLLLGGEDDLAPVIGRLRATGATCPILVLPSKGGSSEMAGLLDAGADDVLRPPYLGIEIIAKIRSVLRRCLGTAHPRITIGVLQVPLNGDRITLGGTVLTLSAREQDILQLLASAYPRMITKTAIYDSLYALAPSPPHIKVIDSHLHNLRRKLAQADPQGRNFIETSVGIGYRLIQNQNQKAAHSAAPAHSSRAVDLALDEVQEA